MVSQPVRLTKYGLKTFKMAKRIRKKKGVEQDVLTLARARVSEAYDLFDTVAVSFSGGKDSTAVLNLALEEAERRGKLPVPVFHYDEEAIPYETEAYVRRVAQDPRVDMRWLCLPVQHRNACSRKEPYWYPWDPDCPEKWVRPLPPEAITYDMVPGWPADRKKWPTLPDSVGLLFDAQKYGRVGMLLGIRADESITRTRAILMKSQDNKPYIRPWTDGYAEKNLFKVYPVYDWRTPDIWTAPDELGWDYNTSYDLMDKAGINPNLQRVAPPYGEEPMGALWMFAVCFPDIWDKMSERVSGAATAARYSQTELYSFGGVPEKPVNFTWEEWLRYWLNKHPEEHRAGVAKRVKNWIKNHYGKTHEPLAPKAPHPLTGISWNFIIQIAIRGDYKDRKQPMAPPDRVKGRKRYNLEIEEMLKAQMEGAENGKP